MRILTLLTIFAVAVAASQCAAQELKRGALRAESLSPGDPGDAPAGPPVAVAMKDGVAELSPANSKVEFVGTHVGDEPNPRLGGFEKFTGKLEMEGSTPKSLSFEFDTTSLWTELGGNLTDHLKTADFLDVENHPTAKFVSTSISSPDDKGDCKIVGDFTLMGKTNEITLPAAITVNDKAVVLKSEFKLDRTSFGMDKMTERVAKEVSIKVSVGEKTSRPGAGGRQMAGGQAAGRGGRGGFDPAAMFKQADANGDGKLTGDEIPERMKDRMETFDANKDGAITLEELQARTQGGRPSGGGGRPGSGDGGN